MGVTAAASTAACERCASPLEHGDLRCAVCALPAQHVATPVDVPRARILRCTECNAAIAFDPAHQAPACAFCRAVMTVEQPVDPIESAQRYLAFAVEREVATASLRTWLARRGYFAPHALHQEAVLETVTPIYWAAWVVNASARVAWTADSDRGAERSAWAPHAGVTSLVFDDIVVPASRGLHAGECSLLVPFYDLAQLAPVDPADVGGGDVIERSGSAGPRSAAEGRRGDVIESFDVQRSAAREQVQRAITQMAKTRVEDVIPGRRFRNVHVACLLERQTTDRVALPAWVLAYRYRGKPYRAIVHGQRAEVVFGTSPIDWAKVARLAGLLVALALAIVAMVLLLRR